MLGVFVVVSSTSGSCRCCAHTHTHNTEWWSPAMWGQHSPKGSFFLGFPSKWI